MPAPGRDAAEDNGSRAAVDTEPAPGQFRRLIFGSCLVRISRFNGKVRRREEGRLIIAIFWRFSEMGFRRIPQDDGGFWLPFQRGLPKGDLEYTF